MKPSDIWNEPTPAYRNAVTNQPEIPESSIDEVVKDAQYQDWFHAISDDVEFNPTVMCLKWLRQALQAEQDRVIKLAGDYMNESDYENFTKEL